MPEDKIGQGMVDLRLKLDVGYERWLRYSFHHSMSAMMMSDEFSMAMSPTGTGQEVPQAADLSWATVDGDRFTVTNRVDRMWVGFRVPRFDLTIGRQPISFGSAYFFTPMDLVSPFSPMVIDREYKPGIDAVRADVYIGMSGNISLVAAYAGSWDLDGLVLAGHGGFTVGVFDLGLFAGAIHSDVVVGFDFKGALGPVAVQGEATVTFEEDEDPFVRAVVGASYRFGFGLYLMGEVYVQSIGGAEPADYLPLAMSDRFLRGELWSMGRYYAALSASYELTPLINLSLFGICNLADPSFLLGPGFSWSVGDNAELAVGAYFAVGERPDEVDPMDLINPDFTVKSDEEILAAIPVNSEFGLSPHMVHAQMKVYF